MFVPSSFKLSFIWNVAALWWSYLLWAIKFIRREAPKSEGSDIKSKVRFDSQAKRFSFLYAYQVCTPSMYEYEVRHTILNKKIAGWLLLEAAQTSLSNLPLLTASCDIMLHFSWIVYPCFTRNKQIRLHWAECTRVKNKKKKSSTIIFQSINETAVHGASDIMHRVFICDLASIAHVHSRMQREPEASIAAQAAW